MNNSIKARVSRLQAIAAAKQDGVGIVAMNENGEWEASGRAGEPRTFPTEQAACDYLAGCRSIIVIDL